jgi:hypothetical protein
VTQSLQQTPRLVPIHSSYGRHKSFLEIVRQGDRVRVQPTDLGKQTLNRFWHMWLRELILTKTDYVHGFAVEITRGNLVISSSTSEDGLRETVRSLAAEIRPLMHMPLLRWNNRNNDNPRSYGPIEWAILRRNMPIAIIASNMHLPSYAKLSWDPDGEYGFKTARESWGSLQLSYGGGHLSGRELGMIVELHFTLACNA